MHKVFLLTFFCLFALSVVKAQTYTISEVQIQKLETILQSYKSDRQTREKTLSELRSEAEILRTESETLLNNLKAQREQMRSLRNSLTKYEQETQIAQATIEQQMEKIAQTESQLLKAKIKIRNLIIALMVTGLLLIIATGFLFVKLNC